jgi:hypothetical protein
VIATSGGWPDQPPSRDHQGFTVGAGRKSHDPGWRGRPFLIDLADRDCRRAPDLVERSVNSNGLY